MQQRLKKIVEQVCKANIVADIGCDHGLVSQAIIEENRASKVIACDISIKSLSKTQKLAEEFSLNIETRCGDGLRPLKVGEADVVIIAGMGGTLIKNILKNDMEKAKSAQQLLLMPHGNESDLRRFLCENGFAIANEWLIKELGRYYHLICAKAGVWKENDEFYFEIGRKLIENHDKELMGYLKKRIEKTENIIKKAEKGTDTQIYIAELIVLKRRMQEVLKCL